MNVLNVDSVATTPSIGSEAPSGHTNAGSRHRPQTPQCRVVCDGDDGRHASQRSKIDLPRIERAVREILVAIGENPDRDGLRETPLRVARAYGEMFAGLDDDVRRHLARTFEHESDQLIVVGGIDFSSTCEHHLLPFFGKAHIAYLPGNGRVVGLSKLARAVDVFSRRPQLQERLTEQVAESLDEQLSPLGVCVVMEAEHLCMRVRGARKPSAITTTLAARGVYRENAAARAEALSLIKRGYSV